MQDEEYLQNNKFESFEMDAYECWFEILNKDPDNELKVSWKWIWDVWIFKDTVVNHSYSNLFKVMWIERQVFAII